MSIAEKLKNSRGGLVYLVRGKDKGQPAWHYVFLDNLKKPLFLKQLATGSLDVSQFGEIICSGWGENPPQEIIDMITQKYS